MNKAKPSNIFLPVLILALLPALAIAQTTSQVQLANGQTSQTSIGTSAGFSGIFSCNQNGAYAMSVGALGASGGVYVPVADASVELNTGTLVYKECVLREVVDAQRQAATAGITQVATQNIQTGRNGSPQYVVQQGQEVTQVRTTAVTTYIQNNTSSLTPAVQQAIAQGYSMATYNSSSMLTCPYAGAATDFTSANPSGNIWNDILAIATPCNPLFSYVDGNAQALDYAAQEQNCLQNEWQWGGGFYSVTTGSGGPCEQQVITPSSDVNSSYANILNSGYNQLQSANDLGQMVGALFAGISTEVLNGTLGGVTGLTQSIAGQPSYLQQVNSQEGGNLQSTVANAALDNLDPALALEQQYYKIMSQTADDLTGAISQLRNTENTCFQQVVQALCPSGVASNGTCTDINGVQLTISTSTEFSQPLLDAPLSGGESINQLASTTLKNITVSTQALALINQLIQNVSGSSASAQALAVTEVTNLENSGQLHTSPEINAPGTGALAQQTNVQNALNTLTTNTPQLWAGTDPNNTSNNNIPWNGSIGATQLASDPGVGWCNFKNPTTLSAWESLWKT